MTERHDDVELGTGELVYRKYVYGTNYRTAFESSFDAPPSRADYRRMLFVEHLDRTRRLRAIASGR